MPVADIQLIAILATLVLSSIRQDTQQVLGCKVQVICNAWLGKPVIMINTHEVNALGSMNIVI